MLNTFPLSGSRSSCSYAEYLDTCMSVSVSVCVCVCVCVCACLCLSLCLCVILGRQLLAEYLGEIKGAESDLSNTGESRYGGACTAAAFLHQFVDLPEGRGWAHLDIAGVAMASKSHKSWSPKNGTGFGVRLMLDYYLQTEGMGQQQAQKI